MMAAKSKFKLKRTGDWKKLDKILARAPKRIKIAEKLLTKDEAEFFEGEIKRGIKNQAPGGRKFKPLSRSTILARRAAGISGNAALMATGKLVDGIQARRVTGGWFTGIKDKGLAKIGAMNEDGFGPITIRMTKRMRGYLFGVLFKGQPRRGGGRGKGVITIKIPARPFIKPVLKRLGRRQVALKRLMPKYARIFGGDMGRV